MKRRNVQQSFVGEPNPNQEGLAIEGEGQDAVEIEIRGGRVMLTVPATTSDDAIYEQRGYLSGELTLEDGRTLTFEIQDEAVGAQWNVTTEPAKPAEAQQADNDLSTLEPPGGV